MQTHAFRLLPGEDLKKSIQTFVVQHSIAAGAMISIVGSLSKTRLRLAGAKDFYEKEAKVEILSLSGTLSANGSHLHLCVSDSAGHCVGGHLTEGCIINTTAEIVLAELSNVVFKREPDAQTGFDELVVCTLP